MSEANLTHPAAAAEGERVVSVRSLIVPLSGMVLLLPNTAVAEVADYRAPEPATDAPDWFLGAMLWRGRSVPLLAFEQLLGRPAGVGGVHARAVVCNTLSRNPAMPFIAVLAQGIPRLQELKADMFESVEERPATPGVAAVVRFGGLEAVIPDLDVLERQLLQLGVKAG